MSRIPTVVACGGCDTVVPVGEARRRVTAWARLGKGGTLTGLKAIRAHDEYLCDDCIRRMTDRTPAGQATLLDRPAAGG